MMIYPPHDRLLLARSTGEVRRTCPAITPVLGSEMVVNGDMELNSNWPTYAAPTSAAQSALQAHAGTYSWAVDATNGSNKGISQDITTVTGQWIQSTGWLYVVSGNVDFRADSNNYVQNISTTGSWQSCLRTWRAADVSHSCIATSNGLAEFYADDFSWKPLTFASLTTYLGRRTKRPGTYICAPTLTAGTQCGMFISYRDASNFVLAYHDGTRAKLDKCIAGTYTSVISATATYVAGAQLKVIIAANGTDYSLYYNGSAVGTTQAVTDAGLGTMVRGFSTYASNTVGLVTTSTATA